SPHLPHILRRNQTPARRTVSTPGAQGREAAGGEEEGQEEGQEERGDVQDLHLQGAEAGAPRHRHLLQGHVHHELLHQRHLREARRRGRQAGAVQQEAHHHVPGDPDLRPPRPPRRARQARRLRGHQGRHQVHLLVECSCSCVS
uniref:Uncharacterized protein n=1 Tax=Triticum urartu TaxID=4572 RepID=A0A8R7VIS5_TRIUA